MICKGYYEKTLNRNEKTGYTTFSFRPLSYQGKRNQYGCLICHAIVPHFPKKMPLMIEFDDVDTAQIKPKMVVPNSEDKESSISFLIDTFDGVGEKLANQIYDTFGPDIFSFALDRKAIPSLSELPKMSVDLATTIVRALRNSCDVKELYTFLYQFHGTYSQAEQLVKLYGELALNKIRKNPYKYGYGILPYTVQELLAINEKIDPFCSNRIEALVQEMLNRAEQNGHLYIEYNRSNINKLQSIILRDCKQSRKIPFSLIHLCLYRSRFKLEYDDINQTIQLYSNHTYSLEKHLINHINLIRPRNPILTLSDASISKIEQSNGYSYGYTQKCCFRALETTGVKIITGGPGSGKTTTIKGLIEYYRSFNRDAKIALCSPTGKAAKRMEEATGLPAKTIHRLVDYRPFQNDVELRTNTVILDYDMIIVDEMSMADLQMTSLLFGSIRPGTIVLLVGDIDQLASVGAGNILMDFIQSEQFEVYRLDKNFRQGENSVIYTNADKILHGKFDLIESSCFEIHVVDDEKSLKEKSIHFFEKYDSPFMLSPIRKGEAGIMSLNQAYQRTLPRYGAYKEYGESKYYRGDSVIFLSNHYEEDEDTGDDNSYYNGDIGIIDVIYDEGLIISLDNRHITLPNSKLHDIALSYALTIHKSQGSESDTVVIVLPLKYQNMLQRNLLYTAITRAKKRVIILSEKDAYIKAIKQVNAQSRNTKTKNKLKGKFYITQSQM